jgi:transposase
MLKKKVERPTVTRRLRASEMLSNGASDREIVEALQLSRQTVSRYRTLFDVGGVDAILTLGVGGRTSALGEDGADWISAALQRSAKDFGFESDAWTNARLMHLIQSKFGVKFSRVYVWQLATNLGCGHLLSKSRR